MPSLLTQLGLAGDPERPVAFLAESAYFLLAANALSEAQAIFEVVARLLPDDPVGFLGQGEVALARGEFRAGLRCADRAMRTGNTDRNTMATALVVRADAQMGLQRRSEAMEGWQQAMSIAPDSPGAMLARDRLAAWRDLESRRRFGRRPHADGDES